MEKGKEEKLIIGGLDVGNGYMKGEFMTDIGQPTEIIDFPSVATVFTFPTDVKAEGDGIPKTVEDIYNRMDISISSSLVRDGNRRLIGKRAIKNRTIVEDFDVNTMLSKAEQELSAVLTLATFAASSLKSYFRQYGKLPERTLETEVRCVLALPVAEYMKFKEMYEKKLKQGTHLVTFHNFIDPVRVELKFSAVKMTAEGATAQFAISMEKEIAEKADRNKEFTPEYLQNSSSVIGIDIGEGTVNYVVTHDREFAPEVSSTMTTGYGTILDKCVSERLPQTGVSFKNRKELADYLLMKPEAVEKERFEKITAIVENEMEALSKEIVKKLLGKIQSYTKVIFVHGGGSIPLKKKLKPALEAVGERFAGIPIVYISSEDARFLNSRGMFLLAVMIFSESETGTKNK